MYQETIPYYIDDHKFVGHLVSPEGSQKRPAIIIAHAWKGRDEFARHKAEELAELGYVAFAADLYGEGKVVESDEEASALMMPLFLDREQLQSRIIAAYEIVRNHPMVDGSRIGGIGFCFGGLTIIELLRSGVDIRGVVSFHGVLGIRKGDSQARTVPIAPSIKGALLILHGYEDPLVSDEDIKRIQQEMTEANVDWQMYIYSHTVHAFTNPQVHNYEGGLSHQPKSSKRAWQAMQNFFEEVFQGND